METTKQTINEETYCGISAFITEIERERETNNTKTPEEIKEDLELALKLLHEVLDDCDNTMSANEYQATTKDAGKKRYEVTLYYHSNVSIVVDAENEQDAKEIAYNKMDEEENQKQLSENCYCDDDADVIEIEE